MPNLNSSQKLRSLKQILAGYGEAGGGVIVAFSGGVDSALLAKVAHDVLGEKALAATAVSPSLADRELEHCRDFAKDWGLRWVEVETHEMERESYRKNNFDRCYWCKDSLMEGLLGLRDIGTEMVVLGVNTDDLSDHRPGIDAARERGAEFPFLEAGLSKQDVRDISKDLRLKTWDKPAEPCLASRIPFGTQVSVKILSQIDAAESRLKELGFSELRVRHYGDTARIEIAEKELGLAVEKRAEVLTAVCSAGYKFAALDLCGLKTGGLVPDFLKIQQK